MSIIIKTAFDNLDQMLKDEMAKVAADLYSDIVLNTPVDEGTLRNAWDLDLDGATPRITNTMPYAPRLMNGGHSTQAPPDTLNNLVDRHTDRGK